MKSETINVLQIFQDRRQYRVPFYQRAYVWNREDQWERLWSDIQDKANERLADSQPVPHFLGAVVLEPQPRRGILGIEELSIIDGQQRLTTLQYILASLAIALRESGETALLSLVESCRWNLNPETMKNPGIEVFKLWPTFRDREIYSLSTRAESINQLREQFPDNFAKPLKNKKTLNTRSPSIEAIRYFYGQIMKWIAQEDIGAELILRSITEAMLCDIKLVSITLGEEDDAQVIFETLNGHGAQLHATDLIRNFIFMQADRDCVDAIKLYDSLWAQFESDFWSEEQTRGRLKRPRLDWFIQTVLQVEFCEEIDISKLYMGYQRFAKGKNSFEQLNILNNYAKHYSVLISGLGDWPIGKFGLRVKAFDPSTSHSLALLISASGLSEETQHQLYDCIVSYFVRRAVCGLTAKNYNRVFNQLIKRIANHPLTVELLYADLSALEGKAARWPRDDEFQKEWLEAEVYKGRLDSKKLKVILLELEMMMRSSRTEEPILFESEKLDVEHILPISWFEHWALPDGTYAKEDDLNQIDTSSELCPPYLTAMFKREKAKNTIGNLTLLHNGVNRSLQNSPFDKKREVLFAESNLHLNRDLMRAEHWNENQIEQRGQKLFNFAKQIWLGPKGVSEKSWFIENTLTGLENEPITKIKNIFTDNTITSGDSWILKGIEFPHGTQFRATHKGRIYRGEVKDGVLILSDGAEFSSPSSAATHITGTEVNGWKFWECKLPEYSDWLVMGALRE